MRLSLYIASITYGFSLLFSYSLKHSWHPITWINALFFSSLLLLIFGGTLLIIQAGFFNRTISSYKRFFRRTNKMEAFIQEIDGSGKKITPYKVNFYITSPLLKIGIMFFVLSCVLSLIV